MSQLAVISRLAVILVVMVVVVIMIVMVLVVTVIIDVLGVVRIVMAAVGVSCSGDRCAECDERYQHNHKTDEWLPPLHWLFFNYWCWACHRTFTFLEFTHLYSGEKHARTVQLLSADAVRTTDAPRCLSYEIRPWYVTMYRQQG